MAEKRYRVLEGQRYTGKHKVYYGKGEMHRVESETFPASELFGNKENLDMALNGADDIMDNFPTTKDDNGKVVKGKEFVAIKGKEPKIELIKAPEKKGKKKKEDEKK